MAKKKDDPKEKDPDLEDGTLDDPTKIDGDDGNETDWKVSYQGLQKVVSKKDSSITSLTTKVEDLSTQLEEIKNSSGVTEAAKTTAEKALADLEGSLEEATTERDTLQSQLDRQKLVNEEFSELGPMAKYIPAGADLDEYKTNAESFLKDLNSRTQTSVKKTLLGSSPDTPPGEGDDVVFDQGEYDRLWDEVDRLAGVTGKEKEFDEANDQLQVLMEAQNRITS